MSANDYHDLDDPFSGMDQGEDEPGYASNRPFVKSDALDNAIECSIAGKPYVWRTFDGREYKPKEMSLGHLINTLNLVGRRYRARTAAKAQRLFTASGLVENADDAQKMMAKAHYWMCTASNAAAVHSRILAIPIMAKMVKVLKEVHLFDYTWEVLRENLPRLDDGSASPFGHDVGAAMSRAIEETAKRSIDENPTLKDLVYQKKVERVLQNRTFGIKRYGFSEAKAARLWPMPMLPTSESLPWRSPSPRFPEGSAASEAILSAHRRMYAAGEKRELAKKQFDLLWE